jgi:hypothetical protein
MARKKKITTLRGLAVLVCCEAARDNKTNESRIARRLYKATDCGISFWYVKGGVRIAGYAENAGVGVAGYAEGTDVECEPHVLRFPFYPEQFWSAVELADREGCELFDQTHCAECGAEGLCPVEDGGLCDECQGRAE